MFQEFKICNFVFHIIVPALHDIRTQLPLWTTYFFHKIWTYIRKLLRWISFSSRQWNSHSPVAQTWISTAEQASVSSLGRWIHVPNWRMTSGMIIPWTVTNCTHDHELPALRVLCHRGSANRENFMAHTRRWVCYHVGLFATRRHPMCECNMRWLR